MLMHSIVVLCVKGCKIRYCLRACTHLSWTDRTGGFMADDNIMDPQENPTDTGHLPAAGEVGSGQVSYHDPVTQPTDDDTDEPTPGDGDAAGLS